MKHRNGREIFGISFQDLREGGNASRITPVEQRLHRLPMTIVLVPSGPQYGCSIGPEDLDADSRAAYDRWAAAITDPETGRIPGVDA